MVFKSDKTPQELEKIKVQKLAGNIRKAVKVLAKTANARMAKGQVRDYLTQVCSGLEGLATSFEASHGVAPQSPVVPHP